MADLRMTDGISLLALAATLACGPAVGVPEVGSTGDVETSSAPNPTPDPPTPTTAVPPGSSTTSTDGTDGSSSSTGFETTASTGAPTSTGFITNPDGGGILFECSTADQDCARGQKCNAWSNNGEPLWNDTTCVPLDPAADAAGERCNAQDSAYSGVDSCATGSLCWGVNSETLEGTCIPYCVSSELGLFCTDPAALCFLSENEDEVLQLCVPPCELTGGIGCGEGFACRVFGDVPQCVADLSGASGALFESCEDTHSCEPGLRCIDAASVGQCDDPKAASCCTPYCDLDTPTCPDGSSCQPVFDPKTQPELAGIGACGVGDG